MTQVAEARYTWGGDEFLFVEITEGMSLESNFISNSIANALEQRGLDGLVDICPANASLLIRFNPDVIDYRELEKVVKTLEQEVRAATSQVLSTRVIEIPVWYNDPFTNETGSRFREGYHQRPDGNDLDYAAEVNGLANADEFIKRHHESPWLVSMVGFVAGLPFLYQLVDQKEQLQVPKYLSPRTDTPALTIGHGGCFSCIYSVRGAGGYQMFGVAAAPIYDPTQKLTDFSDFMVFFNPGDIVKFTPVTESEYRAIQAEVEAGTFAYKQVPFQFDLGAALADPDSYNKKIMEALDGV